MLRIHALTERLSTDSSSSVFTDSFWRQTDVVITALDNVDARRSVDRLCVQHKIPFVDSGTLGTKGNVQVRLLSVEFVSIG